jgi:hypothetical protein
VVTAALLEGAFPLIKQLQSKVTPWVLKTSNIFEPVSVQASKSTLETGACGSPQTIPTFPVPVAAWLAVTF